MNWKGNCKKKCPKCGSENENHYRYCLNCGAELSESDELEKTDPTNSADETVSPTDDLPPEGENKRNKKKAALIIAIAASLVLVAGIGTSFLASQKNRNEIPDAAADASMEKSKKSHMDHMAVRVSSVVHASSHSARKILSEKSEQASESLKEASETTSETYSERELPLFIQEADYIDDAHTLITLDSGIQEFEVLGELGELDSVPFNIADELWMVEKDGKYSFVNPQGKTVSGSSGSKGIIYRRSLSFGQKGSCACIQDESSSSYTEENKYPLTEDMKHGPSCGVLHGLPYPWGFAVQEDGTVAIEPSRQVSDGSFFEGPYPDQLLFVAENLEDSYTPYIYNPKTDILYGPYSKENPGAISQTKIGAETRLIYDDSTVNGIVNYELAGPFWTQDWNQFVLHSEDDEQQIPGFDDVLLIDYNAFGGIQGLELHVYDKHLNPLYSGNFEAGASPIGSVIPVQVNGIWYLINTDPVQEEQNETASNSTIQMAAGTYTICPDTPDGQLSEDRYYQYDAKGVQPKTAADGSIQFTITNLNIADYSDYEGKMKDGKQLVRLELLELFNGRTVLFYPADTPWDEIDSATQNQLLRMEIPVSEGDTLAGNVIRINGTELTLMQYDAQ